MFAVAVPLTRKWFLQYERFADDALRVALGITLFLAGLHKLVVPGVWQGYYPQWFVDAVTQYISFDVATMLGSFVEIAVGGLLLVERYVFEAAVTAAVLMGGIIIALLTGVSPIDVVIRDIGLLLLAVGVAAEAASTSETRGNGDPQ